MNQPRQMSRRHVKDEQCTSHINVFRHVRVLTHSYDSCLIHMSHDSHTVLHMEVSTARSASHHMDLWNIKWVRDTSHESVTYEMSSWNTKEAKVKAVMTYIVIDTARSDEMKMPCVGASKNQCACEKERERKRKKEKERERKSKKESCHAQTFENAPRQCL